jgi:hypothetical protein
VSCHRQKTLIFTVHLHWFLHFFDTSYLPHPHIASLLANASDAYSPIKLPIKSHNHWRLKKSTVLKITWMDEVLAHKITLYRFKAQWQLYIPPAITLKSISRVSFSWVISAAAVSTLACDGDIGI